jgi:tetratricopeptide (TPR) repeat protein
MIVDQFNRLSSLLFGVDFAEVSRQVSDSKSLFQKAKTLSRQKQLPKAIATAEEILNLWYPIESVSELIVQKITVASLLAEVKHSLSIWQRSWKSQTEKAEKLLNSANEILAKETGTLPSITALSKALNLYQKSYSTYPDERVAIAWNRCENLLEWRQKYQSLVESGEQLATQNYFHQAISRYEKAQKLFATDDVEAAIAHLYSQLEKEEMFAATWRQTYQLSCEGKFPEAIALLETGLAEFPRADGRDFLSKLQNIVRGIEQFHHGWNHEKAGDFDRALPSYKSAQKLLPDIPECPLRKAAVAVKLYQFDLALATLETVTGNQAAYLRGFAHGKKQNWQQANREWQSISDPRVEEQRQILKILVERDRTLSLQQIEQSVDAADFGLAKSISLQFIKKFGSDELVKTNLDEHIIPRIDQETWQNKNWQQIAEFAAQVWRDKGDMVSLHNWAIATYYCWQSNPNKLAEFMPDFIITWSSAIANLSQDYSLKNLPWLSSTAVDLNAVTSDLQKILENAVDSLRDRSLNDYLRLRDLYRQEMVALRLMGTPANSGAKKNNLYLTPGFCSRSQISINQVNYCQNNDHNSNQILQALYTNWGLAVAACVEGDIARAIQIKPAIAPNRNNNIVIVTQQVTQQFAQQFVLYHEGCYHLQQKQWRRAISSLKQAGAAIKANGEWSQEIDRLCQQQRHAISEFNEHLDFAKSWYELLGSQPARSYLAEYQAEQIREQLVAETIQEPTALQKLEEIKRIDPKNPVVLDLIDRIEIVQETRKIDALLKANKLEEAVQQAKRSRHQQVRHKLTEFFVKIFFEGFKSGELTFEDITKLGSWSYELCPEDPTVQEIYQLSKEFKKVHDLMKLDRFDEAVNYAKYSDCDPLKYYLADFFIVHLIKGSKSQQMPYELMQKFGLWAYKLCPDKVEYQQIYRDLGIRRFF